jgi:hypothetical protein
MGGKGSGGGLRKGSVNDPLINIEPGDNSKYLTTALEVQAIGKTKVNFRDADMVRERITAYFTLMAERDQKPTMNGLSMALGVDPKTMREVRDNKPSHRALEKYGYTENGASEEVKQLVRQACNIMSSLWEDYMQNGKINPASGIFLGKNFYGMRDEVEHVISPAHDPADDYSAEEIAKRYIATESSFGNEKVAGLSDDLDDGFDPPDDPWDDIPPE